MKEQYIILRSTTGGTRDPFLGVLSSPAILEAVAKGLRLEFDEFDRRGVSKLTQSSDFLAVAPAIPMKLIAPVDTRDVNELASAEIPWGLKAVGADTSPFSGDGIVVAVLDTGIDASHAAFSGVELLQKDFTGEGSDDSNGHGTHCAGTIFGRISGGARIGVAGGVRKALIGKVIGTEGGGSDQLAEAIKWASENGANVVSMSLGIDFPGLVRRLKEYFGLPLELATSRALEGYRANVQLFERLASLLRIEAQAMIIVAAAGNESQRDLNPGFEIAVSPPAVAEGIISVAALAQGSQGSTVAPFSNTAANVSGPGVDVISAKAGGGFASMSGTSMATPHVAGVAALWAEKIKSVGHLTALHLTSKLLGSATYENIQEGFDPFDVGAGMVRAPQS